MEEDITARRQKLIDFRKLTRLINITDETVETPINSKYRSYTDKKGLSIGVILLLLWLFCVIYFSIMEANIRRIYFPVDYCGNFCGLDNDKILHINCSGRDYSNQPYLLEGQCAKDCPYNISSGTYTCFNPENIKQEKQKNKEDTEINSRKETEPEDQLSKRNVPTKNLFHYSRTPWWKFLIVVIVTIVLCKIAHCHPAIAIFSCYIYVFQILVHCIMVFFISGYFSWWTYEHGIFFVTHILTYSLCIMVVCYYGPLFNILYVAAIGIRRQIRPLILFTLLAAMLQFLILSSSIIALMHLATSTRLKENSLHYEYEELSKQKKLFMAGLVLLTNWTLQFLAGFLCMAIGGAVASTYFKGTKSSPFRSSLWTLKYHMGTIAYWALFQPWIDVLKFFTNFLVLWPSDSVIKVLDYLTLRCEYFSKLALIETAIHGQPLLRSGKRALEMISSHEGVLMAKTLVNLSWLLPQFNFIVITALISRLTFLSNDHVWISFSICLTVNVSVISVFFEISKIFGNTLLICYFEDETINGAITSQLNLDKLKQFLTTAVEFRNKKFNLKEECDRDMLRLQRRYNRT